jgi:nucleoside phosphorylase
MIIVTFALPAESKSFVSRLQNKRGVHKAVGEITLGQIGSQPVSIFHTGVGRNIAQKRLTEFLADQSFEILISSGFAGGVASNLCAGDLFLARNISDSELLAHAQQTLHHLQPHIGKLLTSSGIVHSAAKRMELATERAADAIDMETDVIAQTCGERGIRMLSLRAISDTVREPFPAPPDVLFDMERQKIPFAALAAHCLKNPAAIARLIAFNQQIARAREKLADALTNLIADDSFLA